MGHRKYHAPKHGSLSYLPRHRAKRWMGRVRYWPTSVDETKPLGFVGYKAGMTYVIGTDNRQGSLTYGREIVLPVTILETPPMIVAAVRLYESTVNGLRTLCEAWMEVPPAEFRRILTLPEKFSTQDALNKLESVIGKASELRLVMSTQPKLAKIGRKTPELLEVRLGGKNLKDQFEYAKAILGKEVKISDVFAEGGWIDVIGITKGKGIQGPVKRWGIRKLWHKSRKTVRGVGSIGGWTPHYVMYSVPRAGQMGFHQRTEYNKQILKIGNDGTEITPKGGFIRYGLIENQYIMLKGTVPGPAKRAITLRLAVRGGSFPGPQPKIEMVSLTSKQGS